MKAVSLVLAVLLLFCARAALAEPVWIDVRTAEQHAESHIDGDVHIPLEEIDAEALAAQYGKDAELRLYCRSGNRAGQAMALLQQAGFTNVTNAGGIADVRALRGLTAQSPAAESTGPATIVTTPSR